MTITEVKISVDSYVNPVTVRLGDTVIGHVGDENRWIIVSYIAQAGKGLIFGDAVQYLQDYQVETVLHNTRRRKRRE
jgi:hypothetical protein